MDALLKSNIWKYYLLEFFAMFLLAMPILVLFYQENGLSMTEVFVLQSLFALMIALFEIPSGYFADVIGRRISVIIGSVLWSVGMWIYPFASTFFGFLLAELTAGIGAAFVSGAATALVYDSLVELKQTKQFKQIEGRMVLASTLSESIAAVLGGFLAVISLRIPLFAEAIVITLAIPLAFSFHEPKRDVYLHRGHIENIKRIVRHSLHAHKQIKWLILYGAIIAAATRVVFWMFQPYFKLVGLPLVYFGVAWALINILVGVFAHQAPFVEKKLGKRMSLMILPFLFFGTAMLFGFFVHLWILVFVIGFQFIRGLSMPLLSDYINKYIASKDRATILSIKNLTAQMTFLIMSPAIGFVSDMYTLPIAFTVWGFVILIAGIVSLFYLHKYQVI